MPVKVDIPLAEILRLRLEGKTNREIGLQYDVTESCISRKLKGIFKILKQANPAEYTEHKSAIFTALEEKLLAKLADPKQIKQQDYDVILKAFDKIYDKNRLEMGKATSHQEHHVILTQIHAELFAKRPKINDKDDDDVR